MADNIVVDCTDGKITITPETEAEISERAKIEEEYVASINKQEEEQKILLEQVKSSSDPAVQAMIKLLGLGE